MERFGPRRNFPVKVVHLQRWSFFDWSVQTDRNLQLLFQNSRFQSYFAKQSVITILVETQKDRFVSIENFVSMEQREIKSEYFVVLKGMTAVKNNLQLSKAY